MEDPSTIIPMGTGKRPYRSHKQPACLACRRRRSRCTGGPGPCSLCSIHGTDCIFAETNAPRESDSPADNPASSNNQETPKSTRGKKRRRVEAAEESPSSRLDQESNTRSEVVDQTTNAIPSKSTRSERIIPSIDEELERSRRDFRIPRNQSTPVSTRWSQPAGIPNTGRALSAALRTLGETEHENAHIVGPAVANDAAVLQSYLSATPRHGGGDGDARKMPYSLYSGGPGAAPVLYTQVIKGPVGVRRDRTPGFDQCQIIERLVEPFASDLIDLYFEKLNACLPVLDEAAFRKQYEEDRDGIPRALLANIYGSTLIYWNQSPKLSRHHCPDGRYVWVQAMDCFFRELHYSPSISTIMSALLNVGGRPTTSMTYNAIAMGSIVSLAQSLGLNRDPSNWNISSDEKSRRIRVWWLVFIHDQWCSFAYGTPPHIHSRQYDVPVPTIEHLTGEDQRSPDHGAFQTFILLCTTTEIMSKCLEYVYDLTRHKQSQDTLSRSIQQLKFRLDRWEDNLPDWARNPILRGSASEVPGSSSLRLAYLAIRLLLRRIDLDLERENASGETVSLSHTRIQAQRAAEDIVHFVDDLDHRRLWDVWLPTSAFVFASATTLLVRCALESSDSNVPLSQRTALKQAHHMVEVLKMYRDQYNWDLGDICLAQCNEVVENLMQDNGANSRTAGAVVGLDPFEPELPVLGDLFPSLWDMFDNDIF